MTADDPLSRLSAGLDRAQQLALAASPGPWHPNAEHDEVVAVDDITVCDGFALSGNQLRATVDHIVEVDPAWVLERYVPAIRKVIARHEEAERDSVLSDRDAGFAAGLYAALEYLASIYHRDGEQS
jgi:hypothetical protein